MMATFVRIFFVTLLFFNSAVAGERISATAGTELESNSAHRFSSEDYSWWAVQPVRNPAPPVLADSSPGDWRQHPIDRFVAHRLAEAGLEPAPGAAPEELVRRLFFDLHGLPPTPEEVAEFVVDSKNGMDAAVAALVDRLLDSPRYGERWGQHWLDVARYAESDGYRADFYRPEAWHYREYVIRSFNDDKPYDQFVREQLAADEFAADDPETVIATGFLRHGIYEYNQRNAKMHWELILNEMTNVTGEALLGLGIGCAQCHDHKFDPILQKDYYSLQAFLSSTWWPEDRPMATAEQKAEFRKKQDYWESKSTPIRDEMTALVAEAQNSRSEYAINQFPEDVQAMFRKAPTVRTPYEEQLAQLVQRQVNFEVDMFEPAKSLEKKPEQLARYVALKEQLAALENLQPEPLPMAFIATDIGVQAAPAVFDSQNGRETVEPAFLTLLGQPAPDIVPTAKTTGRRTALANWIARSDNPLSTRVIVNRVWQHHFGRGIVATPNDFGRLGEPPSHPQLLDWLTSRFVHGGWKLKPLHRLILTSAAYRQTARREPSAKASLSDPGNRLLWRFPARRLNAEQVRDAMLAVSGELVDGSGKPSKPGTDNVRSIYVKKIRNTPDPVLHAFDAPSGFESAPDRLQTTTPTQSLMLVNNTWPLKRAEAFARRLLGDKSAITNVEIVRAFQLAYGRDALSEELEIALDFVQTLLTDPLPADEKPKPKFPSETGLRPIDQAFAKVQQLPLGEQALWLQPTSRFEKLAVNDVPAFSDSLTIEAVVTLDGVHSDASVNTLISHWNGEHQTNGWSLGITSAKSRYQPLNLILQLVGSNTGGDTLYEVVPSDLFLLPGRPHYVAVTLHFDREIGCKATFYMKEFSVPDSPMQSATVLSSIAELKLETSKLATVIGGRTRKGHLWDGQIARLAMMPRILNGDALLFSMTGQTHSVDWDFSSENGEHPVPGSHWLRSEKSTEPVDEKNRATLAALTEFCHALLSSNEFLYLH
ncbi:MAG: hypothetical protein ACI9R3_003587 [Verrucomicrobiales bacterium]|jgi:hypothetical protein